MSLLQDPLKEICAAEQKAQELVISAENERLLALKKAGEAGQKEKTTILTKSLDKKNSMIVKAKQETEQLIGCLEREKGGSNQKMVSPEKEQEAIDSVVMSFKELINS